MRAARFVPIALLSLAATALAGGPTVDVSRRPVWQVGDVVTVTEKSERRRELRASDKEGQPMHLSTQVVRVERCLAVDADGNRTKVVAWLPTWSADSGADKKDTSLEGAFVESTGRGKSRSYVLL